MKRLGLLLCAVLCLVCTHTVSAATVSLPSDARAQAGGVVEIPVSIEGAAGVAGFQVVITYDGNILQLIEATSGDLTANWLIAGNTLSNNSLVVLGADLTLQGISVNSGKLCILKFKVTGAAGTSTNLNFRSQNCIIANQQGVTIDSSFIDGRLEVESVPKFASVSGAVTYEGDKTGDIYLAFFSSDNISAEPAMKFKIDTKAGTYNYQLTNITPGSYYLYAWMDINNDGKIEPLTEPFGSYEGNPLELKGDQSVTANINLVDPVEKKVSLPDSTGAPGTEVSIPININEAAGIAKFDFKLWKWDSSILEFVRFEKGNLMKDDWGFETQIVQTGGVRITGTGVNTTLNGSGSLGTIIFKVKSDATIGDSTLVEFDTDNSKMYDSWGNPISTASYTNGTFTVVSGFVYHPADANKDGKIVLAEMVAYATAWKKGTVWPDGPNPIPLSYMVRAAYLWKGGESYDYDQNQQPPACWTRKVK